MNRFENGREVTERDLIKHEVVYERGNIERIKRVMTQSQLSRLLKEPDVLLISVNDGSVATCRKRRSVKKKCRQ